MKPSITCLFVKMRRDTYNHTGNDFLAPKQPVPPRAKIISAGTGTLALEGSWTNETYHTLNKSRRRLHL